MNDFFELETKLKQIRPLPPSTELVSRVERGVADTRPSSASSRKIIHPHRFRTNWLSLGVALAAAAVLLILARIDWKPSLKRGPSVVSATTGASAGTAPQANLFVPAGATQVVYNRQDEGLFFPSGSAQPVRRLRSNTRETLQWRNPSTGASLRVSYPIEQVELIPVSGQ